MLFGKLGFSRFFFSRIKFPSEKVFEVFLGRKTGELPWEMCGKQVFRVE